MAFHKSFGLFVTDVDGEGPFLRISGQLDRNTMKMVERHLEAAREYFEMGIGQVQPAAIRMGIICAAKDKTGVYYRAKIISTSSLITGSVGVHFIDYGHKATISLSAIRFLDSYDPLLLQLCGQATDYYLSSIIHPSGRWEEPLILELKKMLCFTTVKAQTRLPFISISSKKIPFSMVNSDDLSKHLIANKNGISVSLVKQEVLMQITREYNVGSLTDWETKYHPEPASPVTAPTSDKSQEPSGTAPVHSYTPLRMPKQEFLNQLFPSASSPMKISNTYKTRLLDVNSQHDVLISYAEEGPELFAVQLMTDAEKLQDMMDEINRTPHQSLTEPPMIGTVCLGRMAENRKICRAIVMNLSGSQCKLFFVDFGGTEMVNYYDIFDIPEEYVKPNVFAMRFCLSGAKYLQKGPHLNEVFRQLAKGKMMTLKVVPGEGPPLIQYGDLYQERKYILYILMKTVIDTLQFEWLDMLQLGSKHSVLVSYVDSCQKFFIQLSSTIDDLNEMMEAVRVHCENTSSPGHLPVNWACCAKFPHDGNWYRARVRSVAGNKVTVAYVDIGNEHEVDISDLRTITPGLIRLPAQALKCALKGLKDTTEENTASEFFKMLALKKTLGAHILGVISKDTMLVALADYSFSPPLYLKQTINLLLRSRRAVSQVFRGNCNSFASSGAGPHSERERESDYKFDNASENQNSAEDPRQRGRTEKAFGCKDNSRRNPPYTPPYRVEKELPSPVSLETPFLEPSVDPNAQHEVSVSWIVSPDSFYTQILTHQLKFLEMMHSIPEVYKGVKPYSGPIPVGASVLARYPEDGVLYRATVLSIQPSGKYIVQYIDFGNKYLVDTGDIWSLDSQFMELPKMAVHCSLKGVAPKVGEWKASNDIDLCFNAPRYQCVYQESVEGKYKVSLWNNGVSVADMLVDRDLAVVAGPASFRDGAIDLKVMPGQQVLGRVTHVESHSLFYVQLDLDRAALLESAIHKFDASLLRPVTPDDWSRRLHCAVKHGGKIHRAIVSAINAGKVFAHLPDYGNLIETSLENLMILPTELTAYCYQSLPSRLNNYGKKSIELMSPEEMKQQLTGKKVVLYIDDVDEYVLVTTLYDATTGKKIELFTPDEGAYDNVTPLCARAVFNYNFGLAYISHLAGLHEIYLQKSTDADKIDQLLNDIFKFYEEETREPLSNFKPGTLCAAKSSDSNWYRATVTASTEINCTVQFLDYGNTETVPKDSVKKLDPTFYEPNSLALVVGLGLVPNSEEAIKKLNEWTEEKEVQVTVSFGTDGWLASLHLDGVDLSLKLVNENLAAPPKQAEETTEIAAEPISLPEGTMQVYISHIDSPGQFWLQMADEIDAIEEIQAEIQSNVSTYPDIENRETGTLCVAKYSVDDQWYRAEILDSDSDITTVWFIDYGNTDVLDNEPGLLKVIPEHLKGEGHAVKSTVNAVPSGTGQWSEAAADYFAQLVGDTALPVDALVILKDVTTYVDIFVHGQNITDKIVSEGHATRADDSEFWIQLESATDERQNAEFNKN